MKRMMFLLFFAVPGSVRADASDGLDASGQTAQAAALKADATSSLSQNRTTLNSFIGYSDPVELVEGRNPYTIFKVPQDLTLAQVYDMGVLLSNSPTVQAAQASNFSQLTDYLRVLKEKIFNLAHGENNGRVGQVLKTAYAKYQQKNGVDAELMLFLASDVIPLLIQVAQAPQFKEVEEAWTSVYNEFQRLLAAGMFANFLRTVSPEVVNVAVQTLPGAVQQIADAIEPQGRKLKEVIGTVERTVDEELAEVPFMDDQGRQEARQQAKDQAENARNVVDQMVSAARTAERLHQ